MRITSEMMVTRSLHRLGSRMSAFEQTQSRLATGRRMLAPSDDPTGANRVLSLRASRRAREQEARAAAEADSWVSIADTRLQGAVERLHRVRDLAVQAASTIDPPVRASIATELDEIQKELVGIANSDHRGRPLFNGYSATPPVAETPPGSDVWTVSDDGNRLRRRVGETDTVVVNVLATETFVFAGGDDVFTMLSDLKKDVHAGDAGAVSTALARIDSALETIGRAQATIGAAGTRIAAAERRGKDTQLAILSELTKVEDVDMEEAIMGLQMQEVAYQATLQALARALPPSLSSFLR